jgi:hypothetical protein
VRWGGSGGWLRWLEEYRVTTTVAFFVFLLCFGDLECDFSLFGVLRWDDTRYLLFLAVSALHRIGADTGGVGIMIIMNDIERVSFSSLSEISQQIEAIDSLARPRLE